jgi:hypothetical protein
VTKSTPFIPLLYERRGKKKKDPYLSGLFASYSFEEKNFVLLLLFAILPRV